MVHIYAAQKQVPVRCPFRITPSLIPARSCVDAESLPWLMLRPDAVPLLAAVYYCSWGRRAALPPPPARLATRSLLHASGVTHDARSARHSQRKGAACGQRHGTAARGNSHALPKIPQALQRAESSKSRAQGTMSVGCTRPPPATPRRLCEVLQGPGAEDPVHNDSKKAEA